ncbi:MAG: oligosaccharide flippase family protein [Planctomycetota bacterium]
MSPNRHPNPNASEADFHPPPSSWGFAVFGNPLVQVLRFFSKIVLAWFLSPAIFGDVFLAGMLATAISLLAIWGLDDACVFAPRLDQTIWRRLRRFHLWTGLGGSALAAALGWSLLGVWPETGRYLLFLAPMIALAMQAVLPSARLIRARQYRRTFTVEVGSTCAMVAAILISAGLGLEAWSLVVGWYANAATALALSHVQLSHAPLDKTETEVQKLDDRVLSRGFDLALSNLTVMLGQKVESFATRIFLGRAFLGRLEFSWQVSQPTPEFTEQVAERLLMPGFGTAAAETKIQRSEAAFRLVMGTLLPFHLLAAFVIHDLAPQVLPDAWRATGPLIALLVGAAGFRSLEVVAITLLKAQSRSRSVLVLSWLRLALVLFAVTLSLNFGLLALVIGAVIARFASAVIAVRVARNALREATGLELASSDWGLRRLLLAAIVPIAAYLGLSGLDSWRPGIIIGVGIASWWIAGRLSHHPSLRTEIESLR